jgi:ribosomal protein S27AE
VSAQEPQLSQKTGAGVPRPFRHNRVVRRSLGRRGSSGGQPRQAPTCPNCGPFSTMEGYGRFFECQNCGMAASRTNGLGFEYEQGKGLELSLEEVGTV